MKNTLIIALFVLGASAVCADEDAWQRHMNAGSAAHKSGDMGRAAIEFEAAVRATASFGERDARKGSTLNSLAFVYAAQRRHQDAERCYVEGIRALEKALWPTHPEVLNVMSNLANSYIASGRASEAEALLRRVLVAREKTLQPQDPNVARTVYQLAIALHAQGKFIDAESSYRRAIAILEKALGVEHPGIGPMLATLARLYEHLGRLPEAEQLLARAVRNVERASPDDPNLPGLLSDLAAVLDRQGREAEAKQHYNRALATAERAFGSEDPRVASILFNLGNLAGMDRDAVVPLLRRALQIREKTYGPEHPLVASSMTTLAREYARQGLGVEAETLLRRAISIEEKALGPDSPNLATSLLELGRVMRGRGDYNQAEPLLRRALAIERRSSGAEHLRVSFPLDVLAMVMKLQGRYAEAEQLYREALLIRENAPGANQRDVALLLNNLGELYTAQARNHDADALFTRAISMLEKEFDATHFLLAVPLNNLANSLMASGRHTEADPFFARALAIYEKSWGVRHPELAVILGNQGVSYSRQNRLTEARAAFERALSIQEQALHAEHPDTAVTLNNLAVLYAKEKRFDRALLLQGRALAIAEKTLGADNAAVLGPLYNLSALSLGLGETANALQYARRGAKIVEARLLGADGGASAGRLAELRDRAPLFEMQMLAAHTLAEKSPEGSALLITEAFEASQNARASDTANQIARTAARYAAGSGALAQVVRQRQDLLERLRRLDADLVTAASTPAAERNRGRESSIRSQLSITTEQLAKLDQMIRTQFPSYGELTSPKPLSIGAAGSLLREDEALLSYLFFRHEDRGFVWVVRKGQSALLSLETDRRQVEGLVRKLREQLDPTVVDSGQILSNPFNVALAYELYSKILKPAEPHLQGARHLIVVPDAALEGLSFPVLVVERPAAAGASMSRLGGRAGDARNLQVAPGTPTAVAPSSIGTMPLADVPWLARKYAISFLPAVSSLRALRAFASPRLGSEPLRGFGDPILGTSGGTARNANVETLFARGAIANVDEVRKLQRLPETADELRAIAATLKTDTSRLFLGVYATEERVKRMNLAEARVIVFATHGLMSGDFKGLAEPAIVLTPPKAGSELDDGLLTASEISQLKLNADMVVLSACNTAAPDGTPGAEGFSGLARAFFHAGARSLLVSHWAVVSESTVALTTRMFEERATGVPKAQALQRSMLALMSNPDRPEFAHPLFWAPFVVVGEGGTDR